MGEVSEAVLDGDLCEICGDFIDDGFDESPGYPRSCVPCGANDEEDDYDDEG